MKRVKKFGILQTAKVAAIMYFILAFIILLPFGLISSMIGHQAFPGMPFTGLKMFLILPFIYGAFSFVFVALGCLLYNLIAGWTGGIEIEVETTDPNSI